MTGIYKIENKVNGNIYIGSTIDIDTRRDDHFRCLAGNYDRNSHLQNSYNLYGSDAFDFTLVEEMKFPNDYLINHKRLVGEHLTCREQYYIDTLNPQYNIAKIAGTLLGFKLSEEQLRKKRALKVGWKAVYKLDVDNNILKEYDSTVQAAKDLGVHTSSVRVWCRGEIEPRHNFTTCFKEDYPNHPAKIYNRHSFMQYDLQDNFIKEYRTIGELTRLGFNDTRIYMCCRGEAYKHKGFKFKYK